MITQRDPLPQPGRADIRVTAVLAALSDEVRLSVVHTLAGAPEPMPCSAFVLPVTKATMTHHFRVLREAGLIEQRESGTRRLNRLRRADLDARFPGLLAAIGVPPGPQAPVPAAPQPGAAPPASQGG